MSHYDEKDHSLYIGDKIPDAIWGKYCWDGAIIAYEEKEKFYWITIGIFGLKQHYWENNFKIIITSDAPEFEIIADMIRFKDNSIIEEYANELLISHMEPSVVYKLIKRLGNVKYKQGFEDAQEGMRKALGIYTR